MTKFNAKYWLKFSFVNLAIVAALGVLLRYKIGFDFPFFDQRNIHHAHSHLAFTGWITHTLFVLIVNFIYHHLEVPNIKAYRNTHIINLVCAYGMLFSFFIQGYGYASVFFTLLAIAVAIYFTVQVFRDFRKITTYHPGIAWFKAALCLNLCSSFGTFSLVYMILFRHFNENTYLLSEYFYLHFQYNGFFLFSCMGLAVTEILRILPNYRYDQRVFKMFLIAVIPAYFLSVLWAKLPLWLYLMVIAAAILQVVAWFKMVYDICKAFIPGHPVSATMRFLLVFVATAFTIKLLLQLCSTVPFISTLAFGFRHIVIAYLHLVLLAVISGFLLTYLYSLKLFRDHKPTLIALAIFLGGAFLNELVLAIQGIASISYVAIPFANEILLGIAAMLFTGALMILISQRNKIEDTEL